MAVFTVTRTARKTYECGRCLRPITPGTRYVLATITPRDADLGSGRWRSVKEHAAISACYDERTS
jgi:hypothetical protein